MEKVEHRSIHGVPIVNIELVLDEEAKDGWTLVGIVPTDGALYPLQSQVSHTHATLILGRVIPVEVPRPEPMRMT